MLVTEDSKEQIQKCLNCELEFCNNCVDRHEEYVTPELFNWNRPKLTEAQREYIDWYFMGYSDGEIAEKLGKSKNTILARRIQLGLFLLPEKQPRELRKQIARRVLGGRIR